MKTKLNKKKMAAIQKIFFNKRVFLSLLAFILLSSVSYGFLINKIIWNVVSRQKAEASISSLSSRVSTLESSYIALSNSITIDKAHDLGFKEAASASLTYISKNNTSPVLSMRSQ